MEDNNVVVIGIEEEDDKVLNITHIAVMGMTDSGMSNSYVW
jgi:hypothetical protein